MNSLFFYFYFLCLVTLPSIAQFKDPDPERFSGDFLNFDREDTESSVWKKDGLTLFTGSSSIRRWKTLQSDFEGLTALNRGFGGAHLSDVLYHYPRLFQRYHPDRIVLYCGENDLWAGKPVSRVLDDFQTLWKKIQNDLPASSFVYLSCKPSPKRISKWNHYQSLNLRIKNLCLRDSRMTFIDLTPTLLKADEQFIPGLWDPDNLHLNQAGYRRWTRWIRPSLGLRTSDYHQ